MAQKRTFETTFTGPLAGDDYRVATARMNDWRRAEEAKRPGKRLRLLEDGLSVTGDDDTEDERTLTGRFEICASLY